MTATLYSTSDLAAELGVPLTTLHRWAIAEPETLGPTHRAHGSGSRRAWTIEDRDRIRKAAAFRRCLPTLYAGSDTTISPTAMARFVREATRNSVGDWVWECADFTLIVAGEPDYSSMDD